MKVFKNKSMVVGSETKFLCIDGESEFWFYTALEKTINVCVDKQLRSPDGSSLARDFFYHHEKNWLAVLLNLL